MEGLLYLGGPCKVLLSFNATESCSYSEFRNVCLCRYGAGKGKPREKMQIKGEKQT